VADLVQLRASSLPLAFRCPGSLRPSKIQIHETSEASELGTAAHEALRALAERGSIDWDALPELTERYAVSLDELRMLCGAATKLWPAIRESFPNAITEQELRAEILEGVTLTGHVDLYSVTGTVARAGDWKTGRNASLRRAPLARGPGAHRSHGHGDLAA
jgi:RecB family exonuclease